MANKNLKSIKFPGLTDTYVVPQVDTTLTQAGRPADAKATGDEITALKEDLSTLNTEGTVPTSEQMLSDNYTEDSVPYHFRKTASDNADREELEIVGGSVAWNQLERMNRTSGSLSNGIDYTNNGDGSLTLNGTANSLNRALPSNTNTSADVINGHVYLAVTDIASPSQDGVSVGIYVDTAAKKVEYKATAMYKPTSDSGPIQIGYRVAEGAVVNNLKIYGGLHDLTAMFGSTIADHIYSLEQATAGAGVALFKSLFPKDYYAYDAGSIQSVSGLSEHRTVGFNVWDEVWEVGGLSTSTGANSSETDRIRSKNYIHVFPNTNYYFKDPTSNNNLRIVIYDSDKNFVRATNWLGNTAVGTGSNGHYVRFFTGGAYGNVYKNDICVNISDTSKNGTYEPYDGHSYALDDSLTLRGIPTLVDGKIKWDGDVYSPSGKVTRRYGVYTFTGNEIWGTYTAWGSDHTFMSGALSGVNITATTRQILTTVYPTAGFNDVLNGVVTGCILRKLDDNSIRLYFSDPNVTTIEQAQAKFPAGTMLVYPLATPTTEQADPYVNPQICHYDGTEEFVSTGIVPIGHNTKYPDNMRAKLDGLPWNFANLIAPTESGFKATRNYTSGQLLIVNNVLYKATANIANGGTITPNTNVTATTLAEVISALA